MTQPAHGAPRRTTAHDVAQRAGVSRTTVSFVLNDRSDEKGISAVTAERVLQAARDLGYTPDRAARALRSGVSDVVVVVAPALDDVRPLVTLVSTVSDGMARAGLQVATRRVLPGRPLRDLWRGMSPAAVVGFDLDPADLDDLDAAGTPGFSVDEARLDDALGALQADHLLGAGHRALAYAHPAGDRSRACAQRRLAAVRRRCEEVGAPPPLEVSVRIDLESAVAAVRTLTSHPGTTAVCAYNDDHAFALLAGMAALDLRAPDDLAVIGVDNTPLSAVAVPALTTVDPQVVATAHGLVRRILAAVRGAGPVAADAPRPRLVLRRSA